jgi:type IV pilus assembly protein PilB
MTTQPAAHQPTRPRLGDVLVGAKIVTKEQLDLALREQSSWGGRLGQNLLALGFVDETRLTSAMAAHLGLPAVDLDRAKLAPDVNRLLPLELCERYGVVPLQARPAEGKLLIACIDPTNDEALLAVRRTTSLLPVVHVGTPSAIDRAIRRIYYGEAAPTPAPGSPHFTVTRNTMETAAVQNQGRGLEQRVETLEREVERLRALVEDLSRRLPG